MATAIVRLANKSYKVKMDTAKEIRYILESEGTLLPNQPTIQELAALLSGLTSKERKTLQELLTTVS